MSTPGVTTNLLIVVLLYICLRLIALLAFPESLVSVKWSNYYFLLSGSLVLFYLYQVRTKQKNANFFRLVAVVFCTFLAMSITDYVTIWYIVNWGDAEIIQSMAQEEFHASQEELRTMDALNNTTLEDVENTIRARYSFSGILTSLLLYFPFVLILSLLLSALFIKKEVF